MRNENDILKELTAAKTAFAKMNASSASVADIQAASSKVSGLVKELDAFIVQGANKCKKCGGIPMGILKTPAHSHNGMDLPNIWEVGCTACEPFLVEREDGKSMKVNGKVAKMKRRSYSARGFSPAEAVQKWNEEKWVEDFYFERMRGFTPEFV